jgi:hypothetical protein
MTTVETRPRKARNRGWLWFFGALLCLSTIALVFPIIYGRMRMLDGEKLARARALWGERKPKSYRLELMITMPGDPTFTTVFTVRDGKFESQLAASGESVAPMWVNPVTAEFDLMQTILDDSVRRNSFFTSTVADFDPQDGHPLYFLYRDRSFNQLVEIRLIRFEPLPE